MLTTWTIPDSSTAHTPALHTWTTEVIATSLLRPAASVPTAPHLQEAHTKTRTTTTTATPTIVMTTITATTVTDTETFTATAATTAEIATSIMMTSSIWLTMVATSHAIHAAMEAVLAQLTVTALPAYFMRPRTTTEHVLATMDTKETSAR